MHKEVILLKVTKLTSIGISGRLKLTSPIGPTLMSIKSSFSD